VICYENDIDSGFGGFAIRAGHSFVALSKAAA
jgi:hypothetical protein